MAVSGNPRDWIERKELKGTSSLQFPSDLDGTVSNFFEIKFVNYERNATLKKATEAPNSAIIFLPVPVNLTDQTNLMYEEFEGFGGLDNILNQSNPSDALAAAKESGKGFLGAALLGSLRHFSELGAGAVTKALTGQADRSLGTRVGQVASTVAGAAINPALAVEFQGVQRKRYSFTWRLVATSPEESTLINKIIDCINWNSLPEKVSGDWILTYPNIAFMKFHGIQPSGTVDAPRQIIQFGPQGAVVSSFTVEINGSSGQQVFFRDTGEPVEVALHLELQDRGILTKDDIDTGWKS